MRTVRLLAGVVLLGVAVMGLSKISFDVDIFKMLPGHLRQAEGLSLFLKHFARPDELILTIEAPDRDEAEAASDRLAELFRSRPDLVSRVSERPRWETRPDELAELAAYLVINAPTDKVDEVVVRLSPDQVGPTLQESVERLTETLSPEEVVQLGYDPLRFSEAIDGLARTVQGAPGEFASQDGKFRVIYLDAAPELHDYRDTIRWVEAVRKLARDAVAGQPVQIGLTGEPVFMAEISSGMDFDMKISGVVALTIIALIFWTFYRRIRPLIALVSMLLVTFVLALSAAGWFLADLTVLGVGFAAIMIGLSVDFGYLIYQQWVEHGGSAAELRRRCRPNIFWASLTTSASFFMLNASSLPGLSQLGNLVGFGVVIGALVMYYPYAWLVSRLTWKAPVGLGWATRFWSPGVMRAGAWGTGLLVLGLLGVLVVTGGPKIDASTQALRPRNSPADEALTRMYERLSDETNLLSVVVTGRDEAEVLHRLRTISGPLLELGGPETIFTSPEVLWPDEERQRSNLQRLAPLAAEQARLEQAFAQAGFAGEAFTLTRSATSQWAEWAEESLPIWPKNPSSEWILRRLASRGDDGVVALGLLRPSPGREDALAAFEADGVYVVSWSQLGAELKRTVPQEFFWLVVILVSVTFALLWVGFRRLTDVALIAFFVGLTFAALAGAMALIGMDWNFFNMAAVLLLLGTGVDYPMHMILALRGRLGTPGEAQVTMGKVIFLCSSSAVVGFGSICWASNFGLASLGRTCALGLALDALIAVFLVPALWKVGKGNSEVGSAEGTGAR